MSVFRNMATKESLNLVGTTHIGDNEVLESFNVSAVFLPVIFNAVVLFIIGHQKSFKNS